MELRTLEYFLTVANELNITKAAKLLHITQPTLSRQLMALEEELDTVLFIRGKRKITLTSDGLLLKRRAQEILGLVVKTRSEIAKDDDELEGEIAIGLAECHTAHVILPQVIKAFQKLHPRVRFYLTTANADSTKEGLERGLLDFGILLEPVDLTNYNYIRSPHKERWGLLVNKEHPLAKHEFLKPDDLIGIPLINTRRPVVQKEIRSWFMEHYDQLDFVATHNLLSSAYSLIEYNIGSLITFEGSFKIYSIDSIVFVPFEPALISGIVIAWKEDYNLSPLMRKFIDAINDAFKA
ncbi:MAG: LysR family transcriptional regulator [Erysipelotrichaceae bacterium]|nr:LysR family transcriptional regulator [Erysipelotrichaceae bacterium]MDD3810495.1 LysR family transcriptional regulator [Erysipelotrichaceae bacterium]